MLIVLCSFSYWLIQDNKTAYNHIYNVKSFVI